MAKRHRCSKCEELLDDWEPGGTVEVPEEGKVSKWYHMKCYGEVVSKKGKKSKE